MRVGGREDGSPKGQDLSDSRLCKGMLRPLVLQ